MSRSSTHTAYRRIVIRGSLGLLALALAGVLAGCDFKPLSLNLGGRPDKPPATDTAQPAGAQAGQGQQPGSGDPADDLARQAREAAARIDRGLAGSGGPRRPGVPSAGTAVPPPGWERPGEVVGATPMPDAASGGVRPVGLRLPSGGASAPPVTVPPGGAVASPAGQNPGAAPAANPPAGRPPGSPPTVAVDLGPPVVLASGPVLGSGGSPRPSPAAGGADPRTAANTPVAGSTQQPARTSPQALADAIAVTEKIAAAQPNDFRLQLQLRMLYLAAGRTRDAQAPWPVGSAADQKMLSAWVEAAVALEASRSPSSDSPDPHDATLAAVERLRQQLSEQAALKVRTIRLASRVDGFGILTPFDGDVFRPGQWVIVYTELENLTTRLDHDGLYRSELALRLEVLSADGKSLLCQEDKQVVDRSLNQRRDFFLARRMRMPAEMTTGQYVLRVSVEDKVAGKVGESMLRFQVR
jgi:hypothetical protein